MDPPTGRIRREPVPEVGLTVLFEPDQPSLDIVFVHGFTGYPDKTWTHKQGRGGNGLDETRAVEPTLLESSRHRTDGGGEPPTKVRKLQPFFRSGSNAVASTKGVFWPRDLLPKTIPDAKVFTYGYDTHLRHKIFGRAVNKLTVYDLAKDFLVAIEAGRRDDPSRPILFVCHSLGGVIVKEMLRQACHCQDDDLRVVSESTIGVAFFGTPHSGADPRELLHHVLQKLATIAGLSVNEQIVNALLPTSERLRQLRDEFNPIAQQQQWRIYSFQEAYGVRGLGGNRVVDNMSSYLGLGPLETTEHIYSDHMDMCRFPHATDPEYLKVAAALRRMTTGTALRSGEKTHSPAESSPMLSDTQREALLQSLRFSQLDSRLLSVRAAHAKTCSWFLESTAYLEWLDSRKLGDHHGFFWIKAKPGAGKSTLMKFVLTKYRRKFRNGVSFFFNARGAELERTTVGMYRSLLLQILETRPHLCQAFDAAEIAPWNATNDHVWSVESLKRVFEEVVHLLGTSDSVACFIDALDECPETEIRDMVEFFEDLGNYAILNHIGFRVLFSSRHYPHVTICKALDMVLEAQDEHLGDIRKYVESRLKITAKSVEFRDEILARIQEKASGVFMWVVLVVDILNKSHDEGRPSGYIRKKLEDLPGDLSELFRDILMRDLHHKDELLLCLQWILFARRPLMPQELCCAINIATESQPLPKSDLDDDRVELFILNSSKGLAEIIKTRAKGTPKTKDAHDAEEKPEAETRTVQFIHESVRDFLLKEGGLRTLWPHLGDAFVAESHDRLKNCCLMYINIPNILESVGEQKNSTNIADADNELPFLQYATQSVLFHADAAAVGGISQDDWLRNFPLPRWSSLHNTCERYRARRYSKNVTLLYILAENNLGALIPVQASISGQNGLEIEADRFGLPLFAALATKSKKSALAILQVIARAEQSLPKLHDLCGIFGQSEVSGTWNRSFRFVGKSGLVWNALQQRDDLIALFLLTLSLEGRLFFQIEETLEGQRPLIYAAGYALKSVVRALLEAGANIEAKDDCGRTPLIKAAYSIHDDRDNSAVVMNLLDAGANIEAQDYDGLTPLIYAANHADRALVKILMEADAKIEAKDNVGRTALNWAASRGVQDVAEILVQKGAQIETKDDHGRTPLSWAARCGSCNVVETLLQKGAQVDTRDKDGRTPLSWAAGYTQSNERTVEMLLKGGAEIDTKDKDGRTPLSWAAGCSFINAGTVEMLLKWGAQVEAKDKDGRTPLDWAPADNRHRMAELFAATQTVRDDRRDN